VVQRSAAVHCFGQTSELPLLLLLLLPCTWSAACQGGAWRRTCAAAPHSRAAYARRAGKALASAQP
jgi:hypothetical protein